jgi:hypothetical protein
MINNQSSLNDQFNQRLVVDETTGRIGMMYYDTVNDPGRLKTDVLFQSSTDDGVTWSTPLMVTSGMTDETAPAADAGNQYGDYNGISGYNGTFFPSWTDRSISTQEQIWTNATATAPCTPPAAPVGLTAAGGQSRADLSWGAVSGVSEYHVYRATVTGGPYSQVGVSTTTTFSDLGLAAGTYFYVVRSFLGCESANSNEASATVTAPPADFSLSATPASVTVTAGSSAAYTVNITRTGGFTGAVTFSISGLPAGAAGTYNPNPSSGASSALTITTSTTTPVGTYVFTVTGTSGTLTRTTTATLVVQPAPAGNFTLAITPASVTVQSNGGTATYTVNITRTNFTTAVTFSITGLPAGVTASFSPNPATANSSTLTLTVAASAPAGSFVFTVTGTGGGLTRTATATLVKSTQCNGNC